MKTLAPNTLLQDRYLVVHLIGKGGMGEVYLAVDQRLGSAMALKRTYFSDDEMFGNAFEREARTLARLRHPALPKVSDHFTEKDEQYLVMEHIPGDDLAKRLEDTDKPFPLSWVLFWADQLLEALNYLHTHEPPIIHRDIKPQNLKLTDENYIILLDFGLSKNSVENTRISTTGSIVGYTPHYAPMEQIRGTGTNASSDLYSLAATIYQLLTNTVPPDALTRADALLSGLSDPTKPAHEINPEVSPAISEVLARAMELGREKRYSTAREMQKALRSVYAKSQNGTSAKTAVSGANEKQNDAKTNVSKPETEDLVVNLADNSTDAELPQSQYKTVVMPKTATDAEVPEAEEKQLVGNADSADKPEIADSEILLDKPKNTDSEMLQSDVKTEVFLAGSSPAISEYQNKDTTFDDLFSEEDNVSVNEFDSFIADENFSTDEDASPNATVPLISFDEQDLDLRENEADKTSDEAGKDFDDFLTAPENTIAVPVADEIKSRPSAEKIETPKPVKKVQPKKGSSNKKMPAIIGGVLALMILVIGAAGAGWYFLSGANSPTGNENLQPTLSATVEATPEETPVMIANPDNSNAENAESSNSNTDAANINSYITETNNNKTETPVKTPVAGQPTPKPARATPTLKPARAALTPVIKKTPNPIQPTLVKPTPAAVPTATPRPKIIP